MRIAQISTVETPVLREGGDSIEHMVWVLTNELTKLGCNVQVVDDGNARRRARDKRVAKLGDVDAEPSEYLTGQAFDVEHAEQNVLGGDLWLLAFAREPACSFERTLCPGRERQRFDVRRSSAAPQRFDHLVARRGERCSG